MFIYTIYCLIVSLIFASIGIAAKFLSNYNISPYVITFIRFSLSGIVLLPFLKKNDIQKVNSRNLTYLFLMGFVFIVLFNVLFFTAFKYTSAINISLIGATNPMVALLVSSIIALKFPTRRQLIAFICAFTGVALVIISDIPFANLCSGLGSNFGELLAIVAVCAQVCYALLAKRMGNIFSSIFLTCVTGFAGLMFLIPFIIGTDFKALWLNLDVYAIACLLFIGIIGTAISTTLYISMVKKLGAATCSMIVFSTAPIFTAILSIIILHKVPTVWDCAGGVLVLFALFMGLQK